MLGSQSIGGQRNALLICLGAVPAWLALHSSAFAQACDSGNPTNPCYETLNTTMPGYTDALCNDGSSGIYYLRKSSTRSTKWIFYLEGGGECNDPKTCSPRLGDKQHDTTSIGWTLTKTLTTSPQGLMSSNSTDNPYFYDFNAVEVHYCSSDYWSGGKHGTATPKNDGHPDQWSFEGRAIATAAMKDLGARSTQTGFGSATQILFAGSSAGGEGIAVTINDLLGSVPSGVNKKLLAIDAGFSLEVQQFAPHSPPTYFMPQGTPTGVDAIISAGIPYWTGHGDTACAAAAGVSSPPSAAQIACYNTAILLSTKQITLQTFIAENELDGAQLMDEGWPEKGTSASVAKANMEYAFEFADCMLASLQYSAASNPANSIFAPQASYQPGSTTKLLHELFVSNNVFSANQQSFMGSNGTTVYESPSAGLVNFYMHPNTPAALYGNGENYMFSMSPPAPPGCPTVDGQPVDGY